jgi:hypothetical protein
MWTQLVGRLVLKFCLAQLDEMMNGNSELSAAAGAKKALPK